MSKNTKKIVDIARNLPGTEKRAKPNLQSIAPPAPQPPKASKIAVFQLERYNKAMEWAFNTLTAAQYNTLTQVMGDPMVGDYQPQPDAK